MFEKIKIKYLIKINKKKYMDYFNNLKQSDRYLYIKRKSDFRHLYLTPKFKGIALGICHTELFDKKIIKKIIEYFSTTDIILVEKEKLFTNDDIKDFYKINRKIIVDTQYFEKGINFKNEIYQCDINTYVLIIDKIEILTKIAKEKFPFQEEKFMFILTQILKYIKYVDYHDYRTCMANAVLLGTGVCIDFAITLYKCLTDIGIECEIIQGIGKGKEEDNNSNINIITKSDHAWNQVKIGDVWYNVDITWFLQNRNFCWMLTDDTTFTEKNSHITKQKYHFCRENFNREKIKMLYEKCMQYDSLWKRFDCGDKKERL